MKFKFLTALFAFVGYLLPASIAYAFEPVSLDNAILAALSGDEWFQRSEEMESAAMSEAKHAGALPDPMVSLAVMNLPTDSWEFDQENMTQLVLGVTQRFPKGDTRSIQKGKARLQASIQPVLRAEREAMLRLQISKLWLDSYRAAKSIELIEGKRYLFEQLIEITTSRYSSTVGKARQQDVIRAQLELSKLEDRLTNLRMSFARKWAMLSEWLPVEFYESPISLALPKMDTIDRNIGSANDLIYHPKLIAMQKQAEVEKANETLARQDYKPGWALNAQYGYRDDAPTGMERSDFVSVGVSFDLPLFTNNRQDQKVLAAEAKTEIANIDYHLLGKSMWARFLDTSAQVEHLEIRQKLFSDTLLQQVKDQAEASLAAYTNDDGDFADVVRAYIAELNTSIEFMEITVQLLQAIAERNYLMTQYKVETDRPEGVQDAL